LIRKLWTVAWDQWEHRNSISILHDHDSTKLHKIITQDTDRLISRQFVMGVPGLPSNNHYLFQEPLEEILEAQLHVRKQWLTLSKQRSIPRNANSWQIGFFKVLGNAKHLEFSIVSSLSTMSRSSPYVQTEGVLGDFKAFVAL
jgi:hypothetical protein